MRKRVTHLWHVVVTVLCLAALLGWPTAAAAQTVTGQARAVEARLLGPLGGTSAIADTGTLGGPTDAREASQTMGQIFSLLSADTPHATTIGWPDQVASEASVAALAMTVGGNTIGADFVMARASSVLGAADAGTVDIRGLSINGVPIVVTGEPNQAFEIAGGRVVINEQQTSSASTVVNALHVIVRGVADVVVGSARAGVR